MATINDIKSINAIELLLNAGLNWSVTKEPLQTASGLVTDHIAIVRDDNQAILGVHKSGYEAFQNQMMAELLLTLSQNADLPIHKAGLLGNGSKVYIQLKTDNLNLGNDQVRGFLTAVNSFDGSTSFAFGHSTLTISCMNTFFGAYRQLDAKVKHTKSMQVRIENLIRASELIRAEELKNFELIRKMASAPITREMVAETYATMFNVNVEELANKSQEISTRTMNNIHRFQTATATELTTKENTLWGLFSGVTRYTTHMLAEKEESKMFGSIATKERHLFTEFTKAVA